MKTTQIVLAAGTLLVFAAGSAMAVTSAPTLNVTATVSNSASLTLAGAGIGFSDADPDTVPSIASSPGTILFTAKAKTGASGAVTIVALTDADLTSGTDIIPVANVSSSKTVGDAAFVASYNMTKTGPGVTVASWTGSGKKTATYDFHLTNGWYAVGNYSAITTYTLTSP